MYKIFVLTKNGNIINKAGQEFIYKQIFGNKKKKVDLFCGGAFNNPRILSEALPENGKNVSLILLEKDTDGTNLHFFSKGDIKKIKYAILESDSSSWESCKRLMKEGVVK